MKTEISKRIAIVSLVLILFPEILLAYTIEKHPEAQVENRFVVGPAKTEMVVSGGEMKTQVLSVENRMGKRQTFAISFEDFVGSSNPDETVSLLGEKKSDSSLRDYFYVEKKEFTLEQGDRIIIPVTVSIPGNISPGGRFGSVIVSAVSNRNVIDSNDRAYTGATVIGRVATLFFVTIPGDIKSEGQLVSFTTKNNEKFFGSENVSTRLAFQNTGNVNLNPYGGITVRNMFGKVVSKIPLDPWFALPDSTRNRDVVISAAGMFGKYTAIAEINRGYGDVVDEKQISFFVLPVGTLALLIVIVVFVVYGIRKVVTRVKPIA
jgi:hypothetical protein